MPACSRIGDLDIPHPDKCAMPMVRASGSGDVFVDSRPAVRQLDINTVHTFLSGEECVPHVGAVAVGSTSVFINGLGSGRVGDILVGAGSGGASFCTAIAQGSENVFAG